LAEPADVAQEVVLGIDFGTSCTSAGALVGDRVELVQDNGDPVIPSVVYVPDRGAIEVGRRAANRLLTDPVGVIRSVKRVLGVPPTSPMVRRFASGAGFRVDAAGDRVLLKLRSGDLVPEQVAAAVIGRIRELAEMRFGGKITKAVFTASAAPPAGYREALTRAARLAHLEVLEVVAEPIAGALSLGIHAQQAERKLIVCDFGGGTFDVSAITQSGLRFSPVATFGDPYLGGDDLDEALATAVAGVVFRQGGYEMQKDAVRWSQLMFRCESAKRQLSTQREATLSMREAFVQNGRARDLELVIDRPWVEAGWQNLLCRAIDVVVEALRRAQWRPDEVQAVALIGGSSLVPAFRKAISQLFPGRQLLSSPQADLAVAIGATLLTARFGVERRAVPVLEQRAAG
jgi:molecular chaperone DnaK (HSP70)